MIKSPQRGADPKGTLGRRHQHRRDECGACFSCSREHEENKLQRIQGDRLSSHQLLHIGLAVTASVAKPLDSVGRGGVMAVALA